MPCRLAISMRVTVEQAYEEYRDSATHDLVAFLGGLGIAPLLVPNAPDAVASVLADVPVDGILLPGGNNVCSNSYEEDGPDVADSYELRDATERCLIEWGLQHCLPVLGICRGMQMLNVFFGGSIRTDIHAVGGGRVSHAAGSHEIRLDEARCPIPVVDAEMVVNSYHRQGLTRDDLAGDLSCFAVCEGDGVVEAFVHDALPIVGVQWHPERPNEAGGFDEALLCAMFIEKTIAARGGGAGGGGQ